jgi:hypothetical protein
MTTPAAAPSVSGAVTPVTANVRSRKGIVASKKRHATTTMTATNGGSTGGTGGSGRRRRRRRKHTALEDEGLLENDSSSSSPSSRWRQWCFCRDRKFVRSTLSCMNFVARVLLWCSVLAMVVLVVWYSYELKNNGYVFVEREREREKKIDINFALATTN